MSRRKRVIAAIDAAIEGKKWQLEKLRGESYGYGQGIERHIANTEDERRDFISLREDIKSGARI